MLRRAHARLDAAGQAVGQQWREAHDARLEPVVAQPGGAQVGELGGEVGGVPGQVKGLGLRVRVGLGVRVRVRVRVRG